MKHKIAVMLIMIMTLTMFFSSFAYADKGTVGIKVEFDKAAYVTGETATATLTLTGMDSGKTLRAFQTYLVFDDKIIEFESAEFDEKFKDEENAINYINLVEDSTNTIVAYLDYPSGIIQSVGTEMELGKINFTVIGDAGSEIKLDFVGEAYKHIVARPIMTEDETAMDSHYKITDKTKATATVKSVVAGNTSAKLEGNKVKASIDIALPKSQSAVLIAQLYDTQTKLTKGTVVEPIEKNEISAVSKKFNMEFNGISAKDNLVVRYYLWESFANMKALTTIPQQEIE